MTFGGQSVTFVTVADTGDAGYGGLKAKSRTEVAVPGCHFRPFRTEESADSETNTTTEVWKLTAPPVAAVLAAKSSDELKFGDDTFQILGPIQPKYDLSDQVHHVTVMCKRQAG